MSDLSLLIIALLVLALMLRVDFIFYIVYVVAGIYLWSRWYTPRAFGKLQLERRFSDHAFLREKITVNLALRNTGRLPIPWLQFAERAAPELTGGRTISYALSLRGRETARFAYEVHPSRRGYYRLGPLQVRGGDLFGWNEQSAHSGIDFLTVYPRIIPLTRLGLPSRLPFGTIASQQRLFEDPARPVGVRDYRAGDSLRQINWKVSAHSDNLLVKTLQPAISLETAILLNLNVDDYAARQRYSAPEWAIEVAASIAAHLVDRKQAVGLMTNGTDPLLQGSAEEALLFDEVTGRLQLDGAEDADGLALLPTPIPPRSGRAHLMKLLELLARIEVARSVSVPNWTARATLHLSWGVTIPVITPRGDEETCQALHKLVRAGFNPVLVVISPTLNFGRVQQRARQLGFSAHLVTEKKELDAWQRPQGVRGWP